MCILYIYRYIAINHSLGSVLLQTQNYFIASNLVVYKIYIYIIGSRLIIAGMITKLVC